MPSELLPAIEIETAPNPDAAVIWLHGLGDDGSGWSQVVGSLALPHAMAIRFVFPHAPEMPVTINNGMVMRAWYDIREANFNSRADLDGVRRAGFSQGGAVALYTALRHQERLAGVLALSTYLIDAASLVTEASSANRDVPIFMAHGMQDPVVMFAWAEMSRRTLVQAGWNVDWHAYPMPHAATLEEIVACGKFLAAQLA